MLDKIFNKYNFKKFYEYKNIIFISSSNILQQIFTFFVTLLIIKLYGPEMYGEYIIIIALTNLLIMFTNPTLNPFFVREGSKEYNYKNKVSDSFSLVIIFNFCLISFLILSIDYLSNVITIFQNEFINLIKIMLVCFFLVNFLKILSRITNEYFKYFFINLIEKSLLLFFLILFIFLFENEFFKEMISYYSYVFLIMIFLATFFLRNNFLFTISNLKNNIPNFFKSIVPIYFSTILFLFVNQHYLVINLENNNTDNVIIGSIGLGFLILNMVYFPIYWLEQYLSQFYYKKIRKFNEFIFRDYFNKFGLISAYISILCSSIIFLLVSNTQFLFLFDHQIYMYKNLVSLIILMSLSVCLDTILAIPIYAIKKEKFMAIALTIRLIIFSYFIFNDTNYDLLLFIFIILNYFQNILLKLFIYLKYKFINIHSLILIIFLMINLFFYFFEYYLVVNILITFVCFYSIFILLKNKNLFFNLIINRKL